MKIHTVLVCDDKWGIARNGRLPVFLKKEKTYFHKIVTDTRYLPPGRRNMCIMGRKTWDAETTSNAPYSRKETYNFILSKSLKEKPADSDGIISSVEEFVSLMESPEWKNKIGRIFNIGGGEACQHIYQTKYCGRAYISRVKGDFQCDKFCPNLDDDKTFNKVDKKFPYEEIIPNGIQTELDGKEWMVKIYEKIN